MPNHPPDDGHIAEHVNDCDTRCPYEGCRSDDVIAAAGMERIGLEHFDGCCLHGKDMRCLACGRHWQVVYMLLSYNIKETCDETDLLP